MMQIRLKGIVLAAAVTMAGPLSALAADDFPTDPERADKFCEAIGETPNVAVPPRERLWFKENCICAGERVGCGHAASKRFGERLRAADAALKAEQAADDRRRADAKAAREKRREDERKRAVLIAPARKATADLRRTFWLCSDSDISQDCNPPAEKLEAACKRHGLRVSWDDARWDECYRK